MNFKRKLASVFFIFFFLLSKLFSQEISCNTDSTIIGTVDCLSKHINKYQLVEGNDSAFAMPLNFIINYYADSSIRNKIIETQQLIENYNPQKYITELNSFIDSLTSRRKAFDEKREELARKDSMIIRFDSTGIEENDSSFVELLDLIYEDTTYEKKTDTLNTNYFYPDSLIHSLKTLVDYAANDTNLNWINEVRNDTNYIYITDLEGDSVRIKLFEKNKKIIKFDITDFWGTTYPAVIRDIKPNSFRLLINDTPDMFKDAENKAQKAVGDLLTIKHLGYDIVLKRRPVPMDVNPWVFYGNSRFDATQIVLHQWAKGGESSISFSSGLELYLKYNKEKHSFDNYTKFKFGLIRQGDYEDDSRFFKTNEDRIDIQSQYSYKIYKKFSVSVLGNFKSQFAPSYDYPTDTTRILVSQFMNPAHITFALGLNYKDGKKTTAFLSPLTAKTTLVLKDTIDETKYGIELGEKARYEIGAIFKATNNTKIWGDIAMENTLELFCNYIENPQNIDLDWELELVLPVNDFVRATISTHLIYDDDEKITKERPDGTPYESKGLQIRERLSIGFYMKF